VFAAFKSVLTLIKNGSVIFEVRSTKPDNGDTAESGDQKKISKDKKYDRFKGKRTFQKSKVSMGSLKLHPMLRTSAEIICEAALFLNDKENM
jgi:hypothetical protein